MVSKDVIPRFRHGTGRSSELAISFLEGPGKSGYQYARLFAEENRITPTNVIAPDNVEEILKKGTAKAVVWLDDFIGTGETAIKCFEKSCDDLRRLQRTYGTKFFLATMAGLQDSQSRVEAALDSMSLHVSVRVSDPLSEKNCCFSPDAGIFADDDELERAKRVATDYGRRLYGSHPLGFGDRGTLVVFERSCPNNNLPIFWSTSRDWIALFPR